MENKDLKLKNGSLNKVRYTGETEFLYFTHGKIYEVLAEEKGWFKIVDDSGESYLYPPDLFERVS